MEIASTLINAFVVVAVGVFLTYMTRDRIANLKAELKADIARLDTGQRELRVGHVELRSDLRRLEDRMDAGFAAVRSEFNSHFGTVESQITAIALAVGADTPRSSPQSGSA